VDGLRTLKYANIRARKYAHKYMPCERAQRP
jgi:hypothetical protein